MIEQYNFIFVKIKNEFFFILKTRKKNEEPTIEILMDSQQVFEIDHLISDFKKDKKIFYQDLFHWSFIILSIILILFFLFQIFLSLKFYFEHHRSQIEQSAKLECYFNNSQLCLSNLTRCVDNFNSCVRSIFNSQNSSIDFNSTCLI